MVSRAFTILKQPSCPHPRQGEAEGHDSDCRNAENTQDRAPICADEARSATRARAEEALPAPAQALSSPASALSISATVLPIP